MDCINHLIKPHGFDISFPMQLSFKRFKFGLVLKYFHVLYLKKIVNIYQFHLLTQMIF